MQGLQGSRTQIGLAQASWPSCCSTRTSYQCGPGAATVFREVPLPVHAPLLHVQTRVPRQRSDWHDLDGFVGPDRTAGMARFIRSARSRSAHTGQKQHLPEVLLECLPASRQTRPSVSPPRPERFAGSNIAKLPHGDFNNLQPRAGFNDTNLSGFVTNASNGCFGTSRIPAGTDRRPAQVAGATDRFPGCKDRRLVSWKR
jgi:hypothetical protein